MPGRFIVKNSQQVLDIREQLSDQELRFAQGADGELDPLYALEAAIDLLREPDPQDVANQRHSRSLSRWLFPKRPTTLGGAS